MHVQIVNKLLRLLGLSGSDGLESYPPFHLERVWVCTRVNNIIEKISHFEFNFNIFN